MLQYLVNATMIWLLSLLAFDLLLRRESYHSYNRLYLLLTFLLGIFLPLWQWNYDNTLYDAVSNTATVSGIVTAKQDIVNTPAVQNTGTNHLQWLWIAYITGAAISAILFIKDIVVLIRYTRQGKKSKDGVWHIIETGKKHSPFSAFRYVFISSKDDYEPAELRMILLHEEQHGHALHFIDTVLMQLSKIVFWFHPLVYMYNKRLMILHEYQADAAAEQSPEIYGRFLVQQALLHPAPALAHSFNRSPIKNRILMLTRKSSFTAGFKRLAAIPVCIICIFLFTENAISQVSKKEGNKLYFNGNVFELWSPKSTPDTIMVQDPVTGDMQLVITRIDSFPVRMNGKEIFRVGELSNFERPDYDKTTAIELQKYFAEKMRPAMNPLKDGEYRINTYLILDVEGKVVYYDAPRIGVRGKMRDLTDAEKAQVKMVEAELEQIINNTGKKFTPVKRGGKPVIMRIEELFPRELYFRVKNHKTVY